MDDLEPPRPHVRRPDDIPRSAIADAPLSLSARTPGRRGLPPKIGLAALGLLVLFAIVAALWGASKFRDHRHSAAGVAAAMGAASLSPDSGMRQPS